MSYEEDRLDEASPPRLTWDAEGVATVRGTAALAVNDAVRFFERRASARKEFEILSAGTHRRRGRRFLTKWLIRLWVSLPLALFLVSWGFQGLPQLGEQGILGAIGVLFGLPLAATLVVLPIAYMGYYVPAREAPPQSRFWVLLPHALGMKSESGQILEVPWGQLRLESIETWMHPRFGRGVVESIELAMGADTVLLRRTSGPRGQELLCAVVTRLVRESRLVVDPT